MIATCFDTETTGLIENHTLRLDRQPEVIEFASASVDWGDPVKLLGTYSCLIKPKKFPLSDETKAATPIVDEMLVNEQHFAHYAEKIFAILEGSDVVIGHNLSFDMEMLDLEADRLGKKIVWPDLKLCTVEQSVFFVGKRLNLGDLHERLLGLKQKDAHRAGGDVLTTLACFREMRRLAWL